MKFKQKPVLVIFILICILLAALAFASSIGSVKVPVVSVVKILSGQINPDPQAFIIWEVRFPRVLLGVMVGASLAVAGVILQSLFKNPMAEPYIIGPSFGGALGATLVILYGKSVSESLFTVPMAAFVGSLLTTFWVYRIARIGGITPVSTLLLSGIAVGSFISAIISLLMALSGKDLNTAIFWLMGGLSARNWFHVLMITPFFVIGLIIASIFSRELNVMLLGEGRAHQLGLEVETTKRILVVTSSFLTAAAISVSGLVGFIGLVVPHTVRLFIGPNHRTLIPASAITGAILMVFADTIARVVISPSELPVGIITALFGTPFFIYLLRTRKSIFA